MSEYPDLNKRPSAGGPPPYPQSPGQPQYGYGQQPPPYGQPQYGGYPPVGYGPPVPTYDYASWGSRVAAALLDGLVAIPGTIIVVIGFAMMFAGAETRTTRDGYSEVELNGASVATGVGLIALGFLLGLAIAIWNIIVRQGKTGQSLGKKWMNISTIVERTGQPTGIGTAIVRYLLNSVLTGACLLNILWPLWDAKKQCWHDMILGTVVIRTQPTQAI